MPEEEITYDRDKSCRLDIFLAEKYPQYSRSYFQAIIKRGLAKVNLKECLSSAKLKSGDNIQIKFAERIPDLACEKVDFKVIFEDKDILVIDKPAGIVVHPACGHPGGTIINGIMYHLKNKGGNLPRVGLIHRLDKETSGVLIAAKTEKAYNSLTKQFLNRSVEKTYLALVSGRVDEDEGLIEKPLGRSRIDRKKIAVVSGGKESETYFKTVKRFKSASLLEVKPKTGRTHQIRVHLASIGHGVLGDGDYNAEPQWFGRMMLHAYKLCITHPVSRKKMVFKAGIPDDFGRAIDKL